MKIRRSSMASALNTAIQAQREYERTQLGYERDSALIAGWCEVLGGLRDKSVTVEIVE